MLVLLASGRRNAEIAAELVLSAATVQRHVANIYGKIHAQNRAEATAYALRHRLAIRAPEGRDPPDPSR